jgi:folate-binding protein YgfZ
VAADLTPDIDAEYRQIREECAMLRRESSVISLAGPDAAEYLQGQITNDAIGLAPGSGCYALLLDRKGHVQADMRVLRLGEGDFQIDTSPTAGPGVLKHLRTYMIGRDVSVDRIDRALISLLGPGSTATSGLAPGNEMDFTEARIAGAECLAVATESGLDLFCEPEMAAVVAEQLIAEGAVPVSESAVEIIRVEAGRPRLEKEMNASPMPAEAGVVERAVDFTKGCYIGQEPVARLHYRGRPNRFLRGLRLNGAVADGDSVMLGDRELGTIGTAVVSPASGRIALAILRKEAEPGAEVSVVTKDGEVSATVAPLPLIVEEIH